MRTQFRDTFARLRRHTITGFVFIMPVLITLAVIMKFWNQLLGVGKRATRLLRVDTVLGPSGDAVVAVLLFLLICVVAGYLVRISFLKRVSERIDRQLESLVPGYSQFRSETQKKIGVGAQQQEPVFEACLVRIQELWEPGYVIERNGDGTVTVFVPQAPSGSQGHVYVTDPTRLRMLGIDSLALTASLKLLGKGVVTASGVQRSVSPREGFAAAAIPTTAPSH
jgi:uncharacterized membrane protein